jgi:hypothetical protein
MKIRKADLHPLRQSVHTFVPDLSYLVEKIFNTALGALQQKDAQFLLKHHQYLSC